MFKIFSKFYLLNKYLKCSVWRLAVLTTYIYIYIYVVRRWRVNVKWCNTLLQILLLCIPRYLKSVQSWKFLILDNFHPGTYNGYRVFPGGKAAGAWCCPPTPSKCRGHERVGLYVYSPSGPQWPVVGWSILPHPGTIFPWAMMWGSVVIFWNQKGVRAQKVSINIGLYDSNELVHTDTLQVPALRRLLKTSILKSTNACYHYVVSFCFQSHI